MTLNGHIVGTKGNTGRGIASIVENADYTITINLTDGTSYTTAPIAGFTDVAFDENYDLVVTKTDGTTGTVTTDIETFRGVLEGELDSKANIDGYYESLGSGTADQLSSNIFEEDSEPYHFRTSGGSIGIGDRETDMLVGGSVAWNQLVKNADFASTGSWATASLSINPSGGTCECTLAGSSYGGCLLRTIDSDVVIGHKYFVECSAKIDSSAESLSNLYWGIRGHLTLADLTKGVFTSLATIKNCTEVRNTFIIGNGMSGTVGDKFYVKNPKVIDLTQMFGTTIADYIYSLEQATAGAGVAFFKKLFPKPYYAYNAGELMSVQASSHDMVGVNQWDEVTELGGIDSNGQNSPANNKLRSKNYFRVIGGATYFINSANWSTIPCYDADKNYIGTARNSSATGGYLVYIPTNACYARISFNTAYGTTYNHDICINLHWDGERDGEYEAYVKHSYPLDSSLTLRGIPKIANGKLYYDGDTYESDGKVTRNTILRAYQSGDESLANAITDGTNTVVYSANASTETADTFVNPQIVDDFGTEEYVTTSIVPVGHYTQYMANLKAKLEMSPDSPNGAGDYIVRQTNGENEYVSLASNATIQDIIARLEALEGNTEGGGE